MKKFAHLWSAAFILALPSVSTLSAAEYWLRPGDDGAPPTRGQTYTWDTSTVQWYAASTGGSATTWLNGNTVAFGRSNTGSGEVTINLAGGESRLTTITGIKTEASRSGYSSYRIRLQAAQVETLAFTGDATIDWSFGSSTALALEFGNNIQLTGDITITYPGSTAARVIYNSNQAFAGSFTLTGGTHLNLQTQGTTNNASFILNDSSRLVLDVGSNPMTIGSIAGTSRDAAVFNSANQLILDQSVNTSFSGSVGLASNGWSFTKKGAGILVLDGENFHSFGRAMRIEGGAVYSNGDFRYGIAGADIFVEAGATFGGSVLIENRSVVLETATSHLSPGMFDVATMQRKVGTLTLEKGLTAREGGYLHFTLGMSEANLLEHSQIVLSGGELALGVAKTFSINIHATEELTRGVHTLRLFEIAPDVTIPDNLGVFLSQWEVGAVSPYLIVGENPFALSADGRAIEVVFEAIPEPSTLVSLGLGMASLALWRTRRRSVLRIASHRRVG